MRLFNVPEAYEEESERDPDLLEKTISVITLLAGYSCVDYVKENIVPQVASLAMTINALGGKNEAFNIVNDSLPNGIQACFYGITASLVGNMGGGGIRGSLIGTSILLAGALAHELLINPIPELIERGRFIINTNDIAFIIPGALIGLLAGRLIHKIND